MSENRDECTWVRELFPQARSYLDVYDSYGLMRPRAMFGHCIWLDDDDFARMADTGAAAAVCPTSNLFLGSGLFDFERADAGRHAAVAGARTSAPAPRSRMLQTMNEAYKVARMKGSYLPALRMFYLATLGAARACGWKARSAVSRRALEADFVVLDREATPLLARRTSHCDTLEELLFALALLGDDRTVAATYSYGRLVHER